MLVTPKASGKTWSAFVALYGLLLAIFLLSVHLQLDTAIGKVSYSPIAKLNKEFRSNHGGGPELAINTSLVQWNPTIRPSFLRVDRKQNLRVWPVVAFALIRSPPLTYSL
jgi:hypothetical protein